LPLADAGPAGSAIGGRDISDTLAHAFHQGSPAAENLTQIMFRRREMDQIAVTARDGSGMAIAPLVVFQRDDEG